MTTDPAADAAVRAQLGQQAATVQGDPAAAGIFGDPAGRSEPPQPIDLGAAKRTTVDPDELLAMLQRQAEQIAQMQADRDAERKAAEPAPSEPRNVAPSLGNASGEINEAFAYLHKRLHAVEAHLGLDAVKAVEAEL
jgi:hypothetical protein